MSTQPPSHSEEIQVEALRTARNGHEGVRRGSERVAEENQGAEKVFRRQLRIRRLSEAKADNEKKESDDEEDGRWKEDGREEESSQKENSKKEALRK